MRFPGFISQKELDRRLAADRSSIEKDFQVKIAALDRRLVLAHTLLAKRSYDAGKDTRLNADWRPFSTSPDYDISSVLVKVRDRARDLFNNNEVARKACRLVVKNVPGAFGFMFKMKVRMRDDPKQMDIEANRIIKEAFLDWCKAGNCEITGRYPFRKVQQIVELDKFRDGEAVVRKVYDRSLKYGFALQMLEPDVIDETWTRSLDNGNVSRMGVELNQYLKPVGYFLRKFKKNLDLFGMTNYSRDHENVPASLIYHLFNPDHALQTRGISEMVASMVRLRDIGATDEASIVALRAGSAQTAVVRDPDAPGEEFTGTDKDPAGNTIIDLEPLSVVDIGHKELVPFKPSFPDAIYDSLMKSFGRRTASGLDINFHELFSDFSDVNMSSIRWSIFDNRETWMLKQEDTIDQFLERVFADWLESAINTGKIIIPGLRDPATDFDRLNAPFFIGRRWPYMQPREEVTAKAQQLETGMTSLIRVHMEAGDDTDEIFDEIQEVEKMAAMRGIKINFSLGASGRWPSSEQPMGVDQPGDQPGLADEGKKPGKKNGQLVLNN